MVLFRSIQFLVQIVIFVFAVVTAVRAAQFRRDEYLAAQRPPWIRIVLGVATPFAAICPLAVAVPLYYWIGVHPALIRARLQAAAAEPGDEERIRQARQRYHDEIGARPGTPEAAAAAGRERSAQGDHGTALLFFEEAIRRLYDAYVTHRMAGRQPAIEDSRILADYLTTLTTVRERRSGAAGGPADNTIRQLQAITGACITAGHDATPYISAIQRLGTTAGTKR
jgi:hypothetical protein